MQRPIPILFNLRRALPLLFAMSATAAAQTAPGAAPLGAHPAGGPPSAVAPTGLDCGRLAAGGATASQAMQDYCARQPGETAYSRAHEAELDSREHRLAALHAQSLSAHGPQSAALQRQMDQEQARIDVLRSARNAHVGHLRDADQLHRARLNGLTDTQRARLGHPRPELARPAPATRPSHPTAAPSLPPLGMPEPANSRAPGGPGTMPRGG